MNYMQWASPQEYSCSIFLFFFLDETQISDVFVFKAILIIKNGFENERVAREDKTRFVFFKSIFTMQLDFVGMYQSSHRVQLNA